LAKEGRHINHWNVCEIRKCGMEKGVKNCAYCIDYSCQKLTAFLENSPEAKETLEEIREQLQK
jgi:aerobic-type carbon monoxide dehydrogenase small subunit (CoxS/CutS family)